MEKKLLFSRLTPQAKAPSRGSTEAAGYDLFTPDEIEIPPHSRRVINTQIQIQIPENHYGHIAARSGLAVNQGLTVLCGTVDRDFLGSLKVVTFNTSGHTAKIEAGKAIAQLILERNSTPPIEEKFSLNNNSERGVKCFGSTDKP